MNDDTNSRISRAINALLFLFLMAPVIAIVFVYAAEAIWDWYMFRQFGPGPSRAVWFGLWSLASLVTVPISHAIARGKDPEIEQHPLRSAIIGQVSVLVLYGLLVVSALFTGLVMGWK